MFHSNTVYGALAYTSRGIDEATGAPMELYGSYDDISIDASVLTMAPGTDVWIWDNQCPSADASKCKIAYKRDYTPIIYYLSSSVVYYGMVT